jgi:hypothetical protein
MERLIAQVQNLQKENLELKERSDINFVHDVVDFEVIRDGVPARWKRSRFI